VEESGLILIRGDVPEVALRKWGEPQKSSINRVVVLAETRKHCLPNIRLGIVSAWGNFLDHKETYVSEKIYRFLFYLTANPDFNCTFTFAIITTISPTFHYVVPKIGHYKTHTI
jgi:hypothetical protein